MTPESSLTHVIDRPGSGRPLVVLHGLGCAASTDYPAVIATPDLAGRRVLLVDLPGHGAGGFPADFGYGIADLAGAVARRLDGIGAFDLFGHSMGGAVAIELAARLAPHVTHLVLGEPNLDPGGGPFSRALAAMPEAAYVARGHARVVAEARRGGNTAWADSMARALPLAVHRAACGLVAGGQPDWRTTLLALPMRRTVLFGARSLPDPDVARLPHSDIATAVIPDCGHSMSHDNPAGLAAAIARACAVPLSPDAPSV